MRFPIMCVPAVVLVAGCAGAFGGYGPGMTEEARTNFGCVADAPGMDAQWSSTGVLGEIIYATF